MHLKQYESWCCVSTVQGWWILGADAAARAARADKWLLHTGNRVRITTQTHHDPESRVVEAGLKEPPLAASWAPVSLTGSSFDM